MKAFFTDLNKKPQDRDQVLKITQIPLKICRLWILHYNRGNLEGCLKKFTPTLHNNNGLLCRV